MNEFGIMAPIIRAAESNFERRETDVENSDGTLTCAVCGKPRSIISVIAGRRMILRCICACDQAQIAEQEKRDVEMQRKARISQLRAQGINTTYQQHNFPAAEPSKIIDLAMRYCCKWENMRDSGTGILFWGNTGTGKTFTAACIANDLVSREVPVLMTSFPKIINSLQGMNGDERNRYLASLNNFHLLVIDDLGAERNTEYAQEIVYSVIDNRYISGLPLIVTTNLTLDELQHTDSVGLRRIYDRLLEICLPVKVAGENRRRRIGDDRKAQARELLYSD